MTRTEMLLTIVAEECAEVIQVASLAQDFGLRTIDIESIESEREDKRMPTNYRSRIALEAEDLFAATEMLQKDRQVPKFNIICKHKKISLNLNPEDNGSIGELIRTSASLAQVCSKALRFGLTHSENPESQTSRIRYQNRDRITLCVADVLGIVERLIRQETIPALNHWRTLRDQKKERVENFFMLSKEIGTLTELVADKKR